MPLDTLKPIEEAVRTQDISKVKAEWDKLKKNVSRQRKVLAKKYHPDRLAQIATGELVGDPTDRMKEINNLVDILLNTHLNMSTRLFISFILSVG